LEHLFVPVARFATVTISENKDIKISLEGLFYGKQDGTDFFLKKKLFLPFHLEKAWATRCCP
jgi:hypothetical protein